MDTGKEFHTSDVLSVATGRLVGRSHIGGVYEICNYMTQDNLFTHQLPRAGRVCEPYLKKEYPWIAELELIDYETELKGLSKEDRQEKINKWLAPILQEHGEYLKVYHIASEDWEFIHPLQELEYMVDKEKIIVISAEEPNNDPA